MRGQGGINNFLCFVQTFLNVRGDSSAGSWSPPRFTNCRERRIKWPLSQRFIVKTEIWMCTKKGGKKQSDDSVVSSSLRHIFSSLLDEHCADAIEYFAFRLLYLKGNSEEMTAGDTTLPLGRRTCRENTRKFLFYFLSVSWIFWWVARIQFSKNNLK